jgi:serine/threonine-protein kinase
VHSDRVPEDHVVDQDPVADGRVVEGGTITLTTSLGPDRREVPESAGAPASRRPQRSRRSGWWPAGRARPSATCRSAPSSHRPRRGESLPPGTEVPWC